MPDTRTPTPTTTPLITPTCSPTPENTRTPGAPVVALVGNPNVGKSTLFNALTGARQHVGNWPGKTVQVARGTWRPADGAPVDLVDLPGTYSLVPRSPDEELTRDLLVDPGAEGRPDLVVVTADAANLARNLYLLAEILETGVRCVVALTMTDVARGRGITVDEAALAGELGVPVIPVVPRRRQGLAALADAVRQELDAHRPARPLHLDVPQDDDPELAAAEARYAWVHEVLAVVRIQRAGAGLTLSDRVDRVLTSRWFGIPAFLAAMWCVFTATTTLAKPLQDGLGAFMDGPVTDAASGALSGAPDWLRGLLVDGLIGGVGQLLTFVPLMVIMFVLLALLEDSGYMARAAFVVDRLMRRLGLPGRAFLPIIVGFGCNVPALAGLRILGNRRQRLLVGMIIPYVSCSARLTVYVLFAAVFFGSTAGTVVFAMYLLSVLLVVGIGMLLRKTLFRELNGEALVLELPPYRLPTLRVVGTQTWQKLAGFLKTAAGVIVATVTAVWLLSAIPLGAASGTSFGEAPIEHSVFGAMSRAAAPAFAPAGFDNWHAAAALGTGFVAKEAVVATVAQTYSADEPEGPDHAGELGTRLHETFEQSSGGHPLPAVLAFLVFLLAYTPCMATIATQWHEMGGRMTLLSTGIQLAVAWLLAIAVFQIGSLWW
ncbi:ferrous iron transport protein B [Streptomyces sp. TRM66268-LWL]|uniref:Ferrous iron transport protein B n=1 Tax=Streptomyces polyasparticus TaxID=2767826 RepID=A0ABR7STA5_9ACTN|nr:ferrous iron transport protein B [Streptomyces polyasparticus]MBC9718725.1 ferrous iron transport protein B [Streptomyces polyasparticus]